MLKFYVDFNYCEDVDAVIVRLDFRLNKEIGEDDVSPGTRVLLYDETMECEAILRRGQHARWVADLQRDTIRDLPEEQWGRLEEK